MFPLGVLKKEQVGGGGYTLDPAKIKLLLHFDGSLVDSSPNNHTMTSGGSVSISTSEPKFGTGKLQFGNTPSRDGFVKSPNIFDFGNKRPFTISFFYRDGDGNGCFFTTSDSSLNTPMVFARGGNLLVGNAALSGFTFVAADMNISSSAYKHCAVVGDGTNIKVYRDGSLIATTPHPSWASASWPIQLGKEVGPFSSNGGMDEFLLYDGVLWESNFTPPLAPFDAASPPSPPVDPSLTLVLLHFDTDYTDSSQTASVWSNSGSGQSISATSKFGAGSLATLGTGGIRTQNATVRTPLGSDNWTIEGWFNKTAIGNDINGLFMFQDGSGSIFKQPITLYIENGILYAAVRFDASTRTTISHQTTIVAGEFTHYALVRNGATITLYLNGVAGTTTINSGALSLYPSDILYCHISQAAKVEWGTLTYLDGLHDEFRYRREAVYTGNFTPPTAPFAF